MAGEEASLPFFDQEPLSASPSTLPSVSSTTMLISQPTPLPYTSLHRASEKSMRCLDTIAVALHDGTPVSNAASTSAASPSRLQKQASRPSTNPATYPSVTTNSSASTTTAGSSSVTAGSGSVTPGSRSVTSSSTGSGPDSHPAPKPPAPAPEAQKPPATAGAPTEPPQKNTEPPNAGSPKAKANSTQPPNAGAPKPKTGSTSTATGGGGPLKEGNLAPAPAPLLIALAAATAASIGWVLLRRIFRPKGDGTSGTQSNGRQSQGSGVGLAGRTAGGAATGTGTGTGTGPLPRGPSTPEAKDGRRRGVGKGGEGDSALASRKQIGGDSYRLAWSGSNGTGGSGGGESEVSARAWQVASFKVDTLYYWAGMAEGRKSLYSAATNPNGYFDLAVAQNTLMFDIIKEKLDKCRDIKEADVARYNSPEGTLPFRETVAALVQRVLLPQGNPKIEASNIVVCAGVSSALDMLAYGICDAGDGILIPTPYYPSFDMDFGTRCACNIVPIETEDKVSFIPTVQDLDRAWKAAPARDRAKWRLLVLTNPGNPTAVVWPRAGVKEMVRWGLCHGMHVLGDEVYAGSIFRPLAAAPAATGQSQAQEGGAGGSPAPKGAFERVVSFQSIFGLGSNQSPSSSPAKTAVAPSLVPEPASGAEGAPRVFGSVLELAEELVGEGAVSRQVAQDRVHVTYGVSKDFTLNGFRCGFIVTRSAPFLAFATKAAFFSWVSQDTQWALLGVLKDTPWVNSFLAESRRRLMKSVAVLRSSLHAAGIPFMEPGAAMFAYIDMRQLLREPSFAAERELWNEMKDEARLMLMPGEATHCPFPGFFRLNYASASLPDFTVACSRLIAFAKKHKKTPASSS